jgi:tripartite ATP-independent transporter DctP family solute receptor
LGFGLKIKMVTGGKLIMRKLFKISFIFVLSGILLSTMFITSSTSAATKPIIFKLALTDTPYIKIGKDESMIHHSYAAMVAFKSSLEKYSKGRIKVQLYPFGRLGDVGSNLEQVLSGALQGSTPPDGNLAGFYPNIQVFSIPYLISTPEEGFELLDGEFGRRLFTDMAKKSGIRVLSIFQNGGFRNFSNRKRLVKTAKDMKGLKIRTMDIPVHMTMVKALGATPTPVAWMELYSALQTGVVDGQEAAAINSLASSLHEVVKYLTLDRHLMSIAFIVTSERWFRALPKNLQKAVIKAGKDGQVAARDTIRENEAAAIEFMKKAGITVYTPTPEELKTFKRAAQAPCVKWLKENINPKLVDEVLALVNKKKK